MNILSRKRIEELKSYGFNFDIGSHISKGIEIVKKDAGLFIGYTLIVGLIYFLVSLFSGLIQFASFNSLALMAFSEILKVFVPQLILPPLMAGYFIASHRMYNNEETEFGDFFKGFEYYSQLVTQAFIILGITFVLLIPIGLLVFMMSGMNIAGVQDFGPLQFLTLALAGLVIFILYVYIMISYFFANTFVVFGDMKAWDAMETSRSIVNKNFWSVFGFGFILGILVIIGALCCYVGLLITIPIAQASIYAAFRDMMGLDNPEFYNKDEDILDHLVD